MVVSIQVPDFVVSADIEVLRILQEPLTTRPRQTLAALDARQVPAVVNLSGIHNSAEHMWSWLVPAALWYDCYKPECLLG